MRWPRFRLRTLMILVTVMAFALGAEATRRRWAEYRRMAAFHWVRSNQMAGAAHEIDFESRYYRPNVERARKELTEAEVRLARYESALKARGPIKGARIAGQFGSLENLVQEARVGLGIRRDSLAEWIRLAEAAEAESTDHREKEAFHERMRQEYLSRW
jgi:hypothetical protein